jgi:tetratricopeptide (TPR) repeat protein
MAPETLTVAVLAILALLALFAAVLHYWRRWFRSVAAAQLAAWRRGDYEAQVRAVEPLRGWKTEAHLFFHAGASFELSGLHGAEECLRQCLRMTKAPRARAIRESHLGHVLLEQRRYAEAIACFERSIAGWPQRGGGHRGIAQTLLRQGVQPDEALRQARQAAELDEANTALGTESRDLNTAESLATLAWAEAVNGGDVPKVEHWLEKAYALCPETIVPVRAQIHYHAGRAYSALGKTKASVWEFERAAKLDPHGNYGRLAKSAMA